MSQMSELRRKVGIKLNFKWKHIETKDKRDVIEWRVCTHELDEIVLCLPSQLTVDQVAAAINEAYEPDDSTTDYYVYVRESSLRRYTVKASSEDVAHDIIELSGNADAVFPMQIVAAEWEIDEVVEVAEDML